VREGSPGGHLTVWGLAERGIAVLGTVGLALYGIVRVGYDGFYARLGVTAEEVGLSYAGILTQAALALLGLCTCVLTAGTLGVVLQWPALRTALRADVVHPSRPRLQPARTQQAVEGQPSPWLLAVALAVTAVLYLAVIAAADLAVIAGRFRTGSWWYGPVVGLLVPFLLGLLAGRALRLVARRRTTWSSLLPVLVVLVLVVPGALSASSKVGDLAAEQVEHGASLRHHSWLPWLPGPGAFGFQADWVLIEWVGGRAPSTLSTPCNVMYLGEAGGRAVLYRPGNGVLRLPAANTVLLPSVAGVADC
jgi:hypothetical protein